jgi:Asp-tRNA(Asn)/Glu-tRNA(Gln) amidotransferase A subunit family amidase
VASLSGLFLKTGIIDISEQIESGELTTEKIRDEVKRTVASSEGDVHAWVVVDPERITEESLTNPQRPYGYQARGLRGIPYGAKDIFNTKDFPTERGSLAWKGYRPGNNARVLDSLGDHGAVLIGKTVTAELAVDEESVCRNPHGLDHSPGTSSGGSAVACATGMVPFALATQSGASIARPASFNGVFGYKPSLGLVPRTGVLKTADTLDTVGFLSSRAENLRPVLEGMRVRGPDYPFVYSNIDRDPDNILHQSEPQRIGVLRTPWWESSETEIRSAFDRSLDAVDSVHSLEVEEIPWPTFLDEVHSLHDLMYCKSLAYYFSEEYEEYQSGFSDVLKGRLDIGRGISGPRYMDAVNRQDQISRALGSVLGEFDAVITLSTTQTAPVRENFPSADPSLIWTFTGIPAATYPLGLSSSSLPIGAQIIGQRWSDFRVISLLEKLVICGVIPGRSLPTCYEASQPI